MAHAALMSPTMGRTMSGMNSVEGIQTMQNLINSTAGGYSSIYQSCLKLKKKLYDVPGMEPFLIDMDYEEENNPDGTDIVTSLWNMLRLGYPLLVLYNALQPKEPLSIPPETPEPKIPKAATFKFLHACMKALHMSSSDVFIITDLYGRDTTGFLKVIKVVDVIIQMLQDNGRLLNNSRYENESETGKAFVHNHEHVINEIVTSERNYISHLDTLQQFKVVCSQNETIIPGNLVHEIFMNLNTLVDHQRRFLIRIEQQNALDPQVQNWGQLFKQYAGGFIIYEPFVANTAKSTTRIQENWDKIRTLPNLPDNLQGLISADNRALCGFMLKPLQRVTKYPLFLEQLIKDKTYDESKKADLMEGKAAINEILEICNNAAARAQKQEEVNDLMERVEDWRGHRTEKFGDLIISGQHTVVKDDVSKTNKERDYHIYLFEQILLCCKEISPSKTKVKLGGNKNNDNKLKKPKLQLKGRIFVQNVTNVNKYRDHKPSLTKPFQLQIYWRGDPSIENFQICFATSAQRDEWFDRIYEQVKKYCDVTGDAIRTVGTSETDFIYLNNANLQNPYSEMDDDENGEDDQQRLSTGSTLVNPDFPGSRNASTPSLRSRSATGSSGPPANPNLPGRNIGPARFGSAEPPSLKVATNFTMATAVATPDAHFGQSYFSPAVESPASMRSSQASAMTPLGLSKLAFAGNTRSMDNKHATAPPGTYHGRQSQRMGEQPNYVALAAAQQLRSRSVSSPDVHNQSPGKRSIGSLHDDAPVPVPPIPPHHHALPLGRPPTNRSQTGSPTDGIRNARSPYPAHPYGHEMHGRTGSRQGLPFPPMSSFGGGQRMWSPAPSLPVDIGMPTQIKVRIAFEKNYVTIVVPSNIKYQTLVDRVDAKMEKHSDCSLAKSSARLRWWDGENYMSLLSEHDIQDCLESWTSKQIQYQEQGKPLPDLELEWHERDGNHEKTHLPAKSHDDGI